MSPAERSWKGHNMIALDHFPVCGGCGDLCGKLARVCFGCGRALYPTDHALEVASRAMQAAPKGEAVPPGNGKAV